MDLQKLQAILAVAGAILLGLPALLHALRLFLKLIPGDPGDAMVGKLEDLSMKFADLIGKLFPQKKDPS